MLTTDWRTHRYALSLSIPRAPFLAALLAGAVGGCGLFSTPPSSSPSPSASPRPFPTPVESPTTGLGTFTQAGVMGVSRIAATATLLADGDVLIAGGRSEGKPLASAELFVPRSGTFVPTGSMTMPRAGHTATLLPNGNVLIVGGAGDNSAEIYNPATGTFTRTGSMIDAFEHRAAVLLANERVLIAGGSGGGITGGYVEFYDYASGRFSRARYLLEARANAYAVTLLDGRILFVGGDQGVTGRYAVILASAEFYNPTTGRFSAAPSMREARSHFAAVRLQDGRVFVAGGLNLAAPSGILKTAEIYDPRTALWTATGSMTTGRSDFTATLLDDGRVLVAGGGDRSAELFDPVSGTFEEAAALMIWPRELQTATLLKDTRVLMVGGNEYTLAEFYNP